MKKIFFSLLIIFAAFSTKAQFGRAASFPTIAGDTLNNASSVNKIFTATAGYNALAVQVNAKQISGTLTGKAYLYTSLDGANYVLTDSAAYAPVPNLTGVAPTYTHVATIQKVTAPGVYYLVSAVSTGTTSSAIKVLYTLRKNIWQ
jgi:hypothetical protein